MFLIRKFNKMSAPAKASIAFMVISFFQKGLVFLINPIFTRILSTDEYGQVSVFYSWVQLIGVFAMLCLSYGVFNNGMLDFKQDRNSFMLSMLALSNAVTLAIIILAAVFYHSVQLILGMQFPLIILMFITFLLQPAFNFWTARQRYEYKYKLSALVTIITSFLSPVSAIICIVLFKNTKVLARLYGGESVLLLCYLFFYIYISVKAKFKVKLSYWKYALAFNLPLIPHYLSLYALNNFDRLMIAKLVDNSSAGIYSVAYSVAATVTIIWSAINSSLIPYTYEKCEKRDYHSISKITMQLITLYAIICVLVIYLAPEFIAILAPGNYHIGIYVIPPVVVGVFFSSLYSIFANIVYYYKKPFYVMIASVLSAIVNILLNFLLIPRFGFIAAGYTTLICYMIQAVIDFFAMRSIVKSSIYNIRYIIVLSGGLFLIAMASNFLYAFPVERYILLAIVAVILFIFRKRLITVFKSIKEF